MSNFVAIPFARFRASRECVSTVEMSRPDFITQAEGNI